VTDDVSPSRDLRVIVVGRGIEHLTIDIPSAIFSKPVKL